MDASERRPWLLQGTMVSLLDLVAWFDWYGFEEFVTPEEYEFLKRAECIAFADFAREPRKRLRRWVLPLVTNTTE